MKQEIKPYKRLFKEATQLTLWVRVPWEQADAFEKTLNRSNWSSDGREGDSFAFDVMDQQDADALEKEIARDPKLRRFDMQFETHKYSSTPY